jgi:hypothetical protein
MAFSCILYLKAECDGCGECEKFYNAFDDDEYNPFDIEYDDEE